MGLLIVELGGGRRRTSDGVDHGVELTEICALGEAVGPDRPLALIHAASASAADAAVSALRAAVTLGEAAPAPAPVVHDRLTGRT